MNFLFRAPSLAVLTCAGERPQHESAHLAPPSPCLTPPLSWVLCLGAGEGSPLPRPTPPQPLPQHPLTPITLGPQKAHCMDIMHSTAMHSRILRPITTTTTTPPPPPGRPPPPPPPAPPGGAPPPGPRPPAPRPCPQLTLVMQGTQRIIMGSPLPHRPPPAARPSPAASAQLCRQPRQLPPTHQAHRGLLGTSLRPAQGTAIATPSALIAWVGLWACLPWSRAPSLA